jgi:hypothetical protein
MANDFEVGRDVLQNLGHIHAEVAQLAAAIGTAVLSGEVGNHFAGKVRGKRLARRPGLRLRLWCGYFYTDFSNSPPGLQLFQPQFELLDLNSYLLAFSAEQHAAKLLDD